MNPETEWTEPLEIEETTVVPIPEVYTYDDIKGLVQFDIWNGLKSDTDVGTDSETQVGTQVGTGSLAGTSAQSFIDTLVDALLAPLERLGNMIIDGVCAIFVPSEDFLSSKVEALCAKFEFVDSIVRTCEALGEGLAGVSTEPPVIYLDLGASRGSYHLGGTVAFLDLRFYAEYKPTVDTIISAFLWICFVWRMLIKLPGIISGMPGDFVAGSAHAMGIMDSLPSRSADLERQRVELRQSIWKGRK